VGATEQLITLSRDVARATVDELAALKRKLPQLLCTRLASSVNSLLSRLVKPAGGLHLRARPAAAPPAALTTPAPKLPFDLKGVSHAKLGRLSEEHLVSACTERSLATPAGADASALIQRLISFRNREAERGASGARKATLLPLRAVRAAMARTVLRAMTAAVMTATASRKQRKQQSRRRRRRRRRQSQRRRRRQRQQPRRRRQPR
jgi:hypothetical protein